MAYAGKDSGRVRREELTAWIMAPPLSGTVFEMREVPHVGYSLTVWLVDLIEDQTKQAESTLTSFFVWRHTVREFLQVSEMACRKRSAHVLFLDPTTLRKGEEVLKWPICW